MNSIETLFDALYTRFLLRDIFAKIVPGTIVILSLSIVQFSITATKEFLLQMGIPSWVLFAGLAWITAYAVQSFGEKLGLIHQWPKEHDEPERRYKLRIRYGELALDHEKRLVERYVIIKEASGVGYVGLGLSLSVLFLKYILLGFFSGSPFTYYRENFQAQYLITIMFVLVLIYSLRNCHFGHLARQYNFIKSVVSVRDNIPIEKLNPAAEAKTKDVRLDVLKKGETTPKVFGGFE